MVAPVLLSSKNSSVVAGTQIGGGLSHQPGSKASSGPGSITAPERICAPMVEAFSITQTLISGLSCFRWIANDSPAGPAHYPSIRRRRVDRDDSTSSVNCRRKRFPPHTRGGVARGCRCDSRGSALAISDFSFGRHPSEQKYVQLRDGHR